ncbi:MAG: 2-hydroxyacid dehydrogenase, partial [Deinococcota bacterium]
MLNIFYYVEAIQGSLELLQTKLADNISFTYGRDLPSPASYDILIDAFPTHERLIASPNLKSVIIPFAGPPKPAQDVLREHPNISVHNAPYNYVPTAETALALMLGAAKFLVKGDQELRQGDWRLRYSERPQLLLQGRTVLILGYGRIGRHMAPVCKALGMDVLGVRRTLSDEDTQDPHAKVYAMTALAELLPRTDVLLIALPETPETTGMIGQAELAQLPENAVLVNVGRGAVVDETALYEALRDGKLAAAGLDVWYIYPRKEDARANTQPSQYPFHELDNVILSPHRAGWLGRDDDSRIYF